MPRTLPTLCAIAGFNIRSFGSWIASRRRWQRGDCNVGVSISALSDRGLLRNVCIVRLVHHGVSISALSDRGLLRGLLVGQVSHRFQYPLFRIVDCFEKSGDISVVVFHVSISALSDRGLLLMFAICFWWSLRVSISALSDRGLLHWWRPCMFQAQAVSISALSDRGLLLRKFSHDVDSLPSFNIRSFGSWIASCHPWHSTGDFCVFQYPLFRIVDCFAVAVNGPFHQVDVSISALSDRGLLQSPLGC